MADAIETFGGRRREDHLQVATLRARSGRVEDPEHLATAAAIALEDERCDLAVELARAAGGDRPSGPLATRLTLAHALSRQGHVDEADAVLSGAEPPPGDDEAWLAVALVAGEHRVWGRGLSAREATASLPPAPSRRAEVTLAAIAAGWALMGGDLAVGDAARHEAKLALDRDADDARLANQLRYADAVAACHRLRGDSGAALAAEGLAASERATGSMAERNQAGFLVAMGLGHLASGRLEEARATFEAGTTIAGRSGLPRGVAFFATSTARFGHLDGRLEDMVHVARRVTRLGDELGLAMAGQLGRFLQALAQAVMGHPAEAELVLAGASPATTPLAGFEQTRAHAWIAASRGELGRAISDLTAAAEAAEADGLSFLELLARLDLVRLGRGAEQVARTSALAAGAEGAFAPAVAGAASAVAAGDGRALLTVVDDFEALGATLVAAELAALAAELHRAGGGAGAAAAAELRCRRLRERCDPAASPAFARLAGDERLTDRERELAELAAQGWSNADIAGHLVLSVRTVENHLQRVYRKLGVRGRSDLAGVLGVTARR
jgi:DNA-binding NarL/FixJ family response regulator